MRPLVLLVAVIALAGCSSPPNASPVDDGRGNDAAPPAENVTSEEPSKQSSNATSPVSNATSGSGPADTAGPATRGITASFELHVADTRQGIDTAPLRNCVFIESPTTTRVHVGSATAKWREGVVDNDLELRFGVDETYVTDRGQLPLGVTLPDSNVTADEHAIILVQIPKDVESTSIVHVTLDLDLTVSGAEPSFTIGGCRVGG